MTPTPLYLKFPDEAAAIAALFIQVPVSYDESGEPVEFEAVPRFQHIDVIGVIYDDPVHEGVEPIARDGWHVNVLLIDEDGSDLEPYMVEPESPRRIWAL